MARPKNSVVKSETTNTKVLNVKFPEDEYETLKKIAKELGDVTLSNMIRILIRNQIKKYEKTGDANSFLNLK